jgi:hypothetical protein
MYVMRCPQDYLCGISLFADRRSTLLSRFPDELYAKEKGNVFFCYALLCFDNCPEKRDESNAHTTGPAGQFIPFFGTLQSSIFEGHMTKKDISLFLRCIAPPDELNANE